MSEREMSGEEVVGAIVGVLTAPERLAAALDSALRVAGRWLYCSDEGDPAWVCAKEVGDAIAAELGPVAPVVRQGGGN
jgi:hypothetical protein